MKTTCRWVLLICCAGLALAGCQAGASPTPNPVDWLRAQPFEPGPSEWPGVVTSGLPEGFEATAPNRYMDVLTSGEEVQITEVQYEHRVGGQGSVEGSVEAGILAYATLSARSEHLELLAAAEYGWSFEQLSGGQVARYYTSGVEGRMWVSGPYVIAVFSAEDRGQLVDTFAELYMAEPPSPESPSPNGLDWLRSQPFEPAPSDCPDVITSDIPVGFEVGEPSCDTNELSGGEYVQITSVLYESRLGGLGSADDSVEVAVLGYPSVEARSEHLDWLVDDDVEWSFEQLSGSQVVRYRMGGGDGRMWVSGPYLVAVVGAEEHGNWVEILAELYVGEYPPE